MTGTELRLCLSVYLSLSCRMKSTATLHQHNIEQRTYDVFPLLQGPVAHVRTVSIGEKRQPTATTHTTVNKNHALITPAPKSTPGTRYCMQQSFVSAIV